MIIQGLMEVLQPMTILLVAIGTVVGIIFGAIPGLTATMAIVMFLPVTYSMAASEGISMLMALYIGGISGGLISAILLNIPGTPSSVATCFDGKPMANKGEAGKALGSGVVFSFVGTIIGIGLLVVLSPVLCGFALKFQAYEYCALAIFSLSMVIALTGHDMPKGLVSAVLGSLLATVGLSPIDSKPRFTFGLYQLNHGFALVVLLIGLFAIAEVMSFAESVRKGQNFTVETDYKIKGAGFSLKEGLAQTKNAIVSALIGVGIGAIIHNWIPEIWIENILGSNNPFGVILATLVGIPMYADIFGTIPVAEALLAKGAQLGTILSFMMAVTTLSLPSLIMLKKAVKPKLLALFIAICTFGIILVGYLFNIFSTLFI